MQGPGWCESIIQRLSHRPKGGAAVAGPGLRVGRAANALEVAATGSHEGSLSMEGIPDRRKRRPLRGGVESGLGGSLTQGTRRRTQKGAGGYSKEAARAKARETEGKSGRRQGCQRLGRIGHRGKKTPTPANEVGDGLGAGRSTEWKACSMRSAEAVRTS